MINKEKVDSILKNNGISYEQILSDEMIHNKACKLIHKSLPAPMKLFVSENKIKGLLDKLLQKIDK